MGKSMPRERGWLGLRDGTGEMGVEGAAAGETIFMLILPVSFLIYILAQLKT